MDSVPAVTPPDLPEDLIKQRVLSGMDAAASIASRHRPQLEAFFQDRTDIPEDVLGVIATVLLDMENAHRLASPIGALKPATMRETGVVRTGVDDSTILNIRERLLGV